MTTSTLRRLSQGLLLTFCLAPAALAGDWVFISNFDKVRAYDFDSGMTIPKPIKSRNTVSRTGISARDKVGLGPVWG